MNPLDDSMIMFLAGRTRVKLNVAHTCQSEHLVDRGAAFLPPVGTFGHIANRQTVAWRGAGACTRPIWGDGKVDGIEHNLCSRCWHSWVAIHGPYRLMQANPAAAAITPSGLARLFAEPSAMPAAKPLRALGHHTDALAYLDWDPAAGSIDHLDFDIDDDLFLDDGLEAA